MPSIEQGVPAAPQLTQYAARHRDTFMCLALLGFATLVPTSIFYIVGTSSQAPGIAFVSLAVCMAAAIGLTARPSIHQMTAGLAFIGIVAVFLLSHGIVASVFQPLEVGRELLSLALLVMMLLGAFVLSFTIFAYNDAATRRAISLLFLLFILIGFAGVAEIRPIEAVYAVRPVFPFTEPSHYALTFTPLLLAFCVSNRRFLRIAALLIAYIVAYLLQSLSLVVGTTIVAFFCLPAIPLIAGTVAFVLMIELVDISYFLDRLDLSYDSGNLSVLVYIQGWELAAEAIARTHWWGIGFQQLGFGPINSPTADIVYRLAGTDTNLKDGGFTLAKILAEFGAFGVVLMVFYTAAMLRCGWLLRTIATGTRSADVSVILALSLVAGFGVEAFVRGIGYFSGSTILLLSALFFLQRHRFMRFNRKTDA